jgi:hypothetical protein
MIKSFASQLEQGIGNSPRSRKAWFCQGTLSWTPEDIKMDLIWLN